VSISRTTTTLAARNVQIHEAKSVTLDIAIETDSVQEEHTVRGEFADPNIKSRFAQNLKSNGINPDSVEESVGGKFVRVAGAGIAMGIQVGAVVLVLIFIVGLVKLKQLQSSSQSYSSIPDSGI
jgi:hypothetical protein